MNEPDLADELGDEERPHLEFKEKADTAHERDKVRQAVCALSNDLPGHGTGHLLIGVDNPGEPTGIDTSDEALLAIASFRNEGKVLPVPAMSVDRRAFKGINVIDVQVEPSPSPPVALDGTVWVRTGPSTRRATKDEERILAEKRRAADRPFDEQPVRGNTISDLDLELFRSTYLPAAVDPAVLDENDRPIEHHLTALRMLDAARSEPTVLGLLVIGFDPTAFLPGAYLQFVRYQGLDEGAAIGDDEELRGNIINQLQTLDRLLKVNIRTGVRDTGGLRQEDRPEYPMGALREAALNAYAHRTYDGSNAPISVRWYDDRVEITSPGGAYGVVTADNYENHNDYRNPGLAAALKHLGYVNRFGRGISLIDKLLAENGNPPRDTQVEQSWWNVTMRSVV